MFPEKLTDEQVKKVTDILKNERLHKKQEHPKDMEKYFLEEYKASEENTYHKGGKKTDHDYDEEDEDEDTRSGHRTVQCAGQ